MNSLDEIRNIHKGKIGYVMGSGTSLKEIDAQEVIKDGVSFAVNELALYLDSFDYYVFTDCAVLQKNYYPVALEKADTVIIANSDLIADYERIENDKKFIFERRLDDHANYEFKPNDNKLIVGHDCVQVATHLAYICGCDPIILLGVDLCWYGDNIHCIKEDSIKSSNPKWKLYPERLEKGGSKTTPQFDYSMNIWETIARENKDNGSLNILNGSLISAIPFFKKICIKCFKNG